MEPADVPVRQIFDDAVLAFFDDLSRSILADPAAQQHPDVVAFAFWCRRSALAQMKSGYADGSIYLGRGLVFHVSPSNVPIMFAYTLAIGLLSGNANIVKLPSRAFPQVDYLCRQMQRLVGQHHALARFLTCVRYGREEVDLTRRLSEVCDVRVIWGGDATVREIRNLPLRPGAVEMVFPDRHSLAVMNGDAWLECKDKRRHVRGFYNDTFLSDQQSCSAPRLVLWLGRRVEEARASFWGLLEELVLARQERAGAHAVNHLEFAYWVLARHPSARLSSGTITRVWCDSLHPELVEGHPGGGVFVESSAADVRALLPLLGRRCQTISYFGVELNEFAALLREVGPRGGNRVVPIGHTLDFALTWDGYDTIRMLARKLDLVAEGGR